jgi:hypothetical protein
VRERERERERERGRERELLKNCMIRGPQKAGNISKMKFLIKNNINVFQKRSIFRFLLF